MKNINDEIEINENFNIIDILMIDHTYLKKCIHILKNKSTQYPEKIIYTRNFLDCLKRHYSAEEKTVYDSLLDVDNLRMEILERIAAHSLAKFKYESIIPKIEKLSFLDDVVEAEVNVLAQLIDQHIDEEEKKLFPKMYLNLDQKILNEMGFQFMIIRRFTSLELKNYPLLQKEVYQKKSTGRDAGPKYIYQCSSDFIKKVNQYIFFLMSPPKIVKTK